jgi:hypothetical protein
MLAIKHYLLRFEAITNYSQVLMLTSFPLTCQYVVNNFLDRRNISQQFYMVNLDISPHVPLKDNSFYRSPSSNC